MNKNNVGLATSQSRQSTTSDIIDEATFAEFLRKECGYENPKDGLPHVKGKTFTGRRPWVEIPHAETGEIKVFWCSESSNHDLDTVRERGLSLRLILRARQDGTYAWFTANEGTGTAQAVSLFASNPTDMPATGPNAEDVF